MKSASIAEIKKELNDQPEDRLREICLRLAKYKVENKELLTYLLYESGDESAYIQGVKSGMEEQFNSLEKEKNLYFLKKSIRRILRVVSRQIKFSEIVETEIELRTHFCVQLKESGIPFRKNPVLVNLYNAQLKKIDQVLSKLPDDYRLDYEEVIRGLKHP